MNNNITKAAKCVKAYQAVHGGEIEYTAVKLWPNLARNFRLTLESEFYSIVELVRNGG